MKFLCCLGLLCVVALPVHALDREAFTFTKFELRGGVEPEQQRLGVRGRIELRNDSQTAQKKLRLQISATLHGSSIQLQGKPVEYTSQTYTSDIDHTGALTEAIVTLPRPIVPKQTIELEIGYEGVIPQDTTRLTRIGVPADVAKHSDWDQISLLFTGVRGIGYVAWYPIATEAANLSEGNSVLEAVGGWKRRESQAEMKVTFNQTDHSDPGPELLCDGRNAKAESGRAGSMPTAQTECSFISFESTVPVFMIGNFETIDQPAVRISFLPEHKPGAEDYARAVEEIAPFVTKWFGDHHDQALSKAQVVELADPDAAPFESGNMLVMPLNVKDSELLLLSLEQLTHVNFPSPRAWIGDGLAHYAQLGFLQERGGRPAVLNYLQTHAASLLGSEVALTKQGATESGNTPAENSLINSADDFYVQAKAMNVWWMLRDMVGEAGLHRALQNYNA